MGGRAPQLRRAPRGNKVAKSQSQNVGDRGFDSLKVYPDPARVKRSSFSPLRSRPIDVNFRR